MINPIEINKYIYIYIYVYIVGMKRTNMELIHSVRIVPGYYCVTTYDDERYDWDKQCPYNILICNTIERYNYKSCAL